MRWLAIVWMGCVAPGCALAVAPIFPDAAPDASPSSDAAIGAADVADARDASQPRARLVAPLSTARVTSAQPTLRWENSNGADGARVELCRDRAMTIGCQDPLATGTSAQPAMPLAPGRWFWRVWARSGDVMASAPSAVWEFSVGMRSSTVDTSWGSTSDFNGDGRDDVAVSVGVTMATQGHVDAFAAPLLPPLDHPATTLSADDLAVRRFGTGMSNVGDTNGDGYPDLLVVSSSQSPAESRAYLYLGGPSGLGLMPAAVISAPDHSFFLPGQTAAGIGDADGDGYGDAAVATYFADTSGGGGLRTAHSVMIFHGGPDGLVTTPAQTLSVDGNAESFLVIAGAGDLNGDGLGDLVAGSMSAVLGADNVHAVSVFLAHPVGYGRRPDVQIFGPDTGDDGFGGAVANGGDLNGDGYSDLVVGSGLVSTSMGNVYVYDGRPSGPRADASRVLYGDEPHAYFGGSVASAGDMDGDGYGDLIVGTVADTPAHIGRAYVYRGSAMGLLPDTRTALTYTGMPEPNFGLYATFVSGVGDTDGDLRSEVAFVVARTNLDTGAGEIVAAMFRTVDAPPILASWTIPDAQTFLALPILVGSAGQ